MKKSPLYTRTGDDGTTSLVGGQRVPKTHARLEAYGTVDELNAQLGLLATYLSDPQDRQTVENVQNTLFTVGAQLATDLTHTTLHPGATLTQADVAHLEQAIDQVDSQLPPLHAFILPGGGQAAAIAHLARTLCRRAERRILALNLDNTTQAPIDAPTGVPIDAPTGARLDPNLLAYINRLSDYLFALARKLNHDAQIEEKIWVKRLQ